MLHESFGEVCHVPVFRVLGADAHDQAQPQNKGFPYLSPFSQPFTSGAASEHGAALTKQGTWLLHGHLPSHLPISGLRCPAWSHSAEPWLQGSEHHDVAVGQALQTL